jgi:hypothetical protein
MASPSDSRTGCRLTLAAGTELARWFTMLLAASLSTSAESLAGEIGAAPTEEAEERTRQAVRETTPAPAPAEPAGGLVAVLRGLIEKVRPAKTTVAAE